MGDGNFFLCSEADQQEVSKTTSPSVATIYIHPSAERGISSGKKWYVFLAYNTSSQLGLHLLLRVCLPAIE
jgi:hypothetical protein